MGFPPAESRVKTLASIGITDIFGTNIRPQQLQHLIELENESIDTMFIIISDLQMDKPQVCFNLFQTFIFYIYLFVYSINVSFPFTIFVFICY